MPSPTHIVEKIKSYLVETFSHKRLWLVLFVFSVLSLVDIPTQHVYGFSGIVIAAYLFFVGAFKASVLTIVAGFLLGRRCTRAVAWILIIIYGLISVINDVAYHLYGFGITRKLILILCQTTGAEIGGFMPGLMSNIRIIMQSPWFLLSIAAFTVMIWQIRKMQNVLFRHIAGAMSGIGMVILVVFSTTYTSGRTANFMSLRIPKYVHEVWQCEKAFRAIAANKLPFPDASSVSSTFRAANIVLVIGESASKKHHSLYGYPLSTTPYLDAMKDSLVVFTDAIGSSQATSYNMERILTFKNDLPSDKEWFHYPTMVDLFKTAGYKFYWLSNQERTGLMSNSSGAIAANADVVRYVGADNSEDVLALRTDDVLLPEIAKALADTTRNKIIVAHLMGSHTQYDYRYPACRSRISAGDEIALKDCPWLTEEKAQVIAHYDNSIRFTDSIVAQVVDMVSVSSLPSVVVYLSDHGENVYDNRDFVGRDPMFVEVPFIIYSNAPYRAVNAEIMGRLGEAASKPVSTSNLIYQLMTLSGTSYKWYDSREDCLSDDFLERIRYIEDSPWVPDMKKAAPGEVQP